MDQRLSGRRVPPFPFRTGGRNERTETRQPYGPPLNQARLDSVKHGVKRGARLIRGKARSPHNTTHQFWPGHRAISG